MSGAPTETLPPSVMPETGRTSHFLLLKRRGRLLGAGRGRTDFHQSHKVSGAEFPTDNGRGGALSVSSLGGGQEGGLEILQRMLVFWLGTGPLGANGKAVWHRR